MSKGEPVLSLTSKDFVWQTFRVGGNGGQRLNSTDTGVRCIHEPSGSRGECRTERSQWQNKKLAFARCASHPAMTRWLKLQVARRLTDIDKRIDEQMQPHNLKIEYGNERGNDAI